MNPHGQHALRSHRRSATPWVRGLAISTLILVLVGIANAQTRPILDRPVPVAAAFAIERLGVRFDALSALFGATGSAAISDGDATKLATEAAKAALSDDWPLVRGKLTEVDASLAGSLQAALRTLSTSADAASARQGAQQVSTLTQQAVSAVEWSGDQGPVARATLITLLLTGTGGLADSYDDAASDGSPLATATAWAALQRAHTLWASLAGFAPKAQATEIAEALNNLHRALPSATPTTKPDGGTSNDVENDSTRIVGALESIVHASLVPDRDLAALAGTVKQVAATACETQGAAAQEGFAAARFYYDGYLQNTTSMLVPSDDTSVQNGLDALVQDANAAGDRCPSLLTALDHVTAALGG
jgi:hypothetical protein